MESVKHRDLESNLIDRRSLKLATKLLAPVCFVSVIFTYSSLLPLISNFVQFPSFNVDKNYVFLLCNGILVLIVKNSGLKISHSHPDSCASFHGEQSTKKIAKPAFGAAEEEKAVVEVEEAREDEQGCREIAVIDEDEDEVNWSLSTDELNKKCDEFIRRMKDEIKSESQQHLVMVR
ncbi:Tetratricopeptide repeat superfamily protein [Salix suchowensis]|nr:Tetratricopeptide repeat superfamily protein [Salix suchowensis]